MIRDHKFYERQSAMSASGHLTASELEELEQHISQCDSCRNCLVEMATVSRELFVAQVWPGNGETPKGMQLRFIQRAVAAGIPLRHEKSPAFDFRFARVAAIAAVLTLFIAATWKFAATPLVERGSGQFSAQMYAKPGAKAESTPQTAGAPVPTGLTKETRGNAKRIKRRSPVPERAILSPFPVVRYGEASHLYPGLDRPLVGNEYAASLFRRKWDSKPEERSFHLDLTLASVSRSDFPFHPALVPALKFTAPVFHIDPSRSW